MALEPITRQEQIIAGKELEPITRMERFLKEYGGASSWNDLTDKPFGETTVKGDTLTWDGNTEGRTMIDFGGGICSYKVSDALLTAKDLVEGTSVSLSFDGEVHSDILANIQNITIMQAEPLMLALNGMPILMCIAEEQAAEYGIEECGTFFTALVMGGYSNVHITSLTIPGYNDFETTTVTPMDEKYMPILTSPSGKKFKMSVDDSGVLSATEV